MLALRNVRIINFSLFGPKTHKYGPISIKFGSIPSAIPSLTQPVAWENLPPQKNYFNAGFCAGN